MEKAGIRPWETQLSQKHNVSAGRTGDSRETPCSQLQRALEFSENSGDADDGRGLRLWEGPECWEGPKSWEGPESWEGNKGWEELQVLQFFFKIPDEASHHRHTTS